VRAVSGIAPCTQPWAPAGPVPAELGSREAAELLGVAPEMLEHWSRQHAFPSDVGAPGAARFRYAEIEALSETLPSAHSVLGAIRAARTHFYR
jgi:hypothetical protein